VEDSLLDIDFPWHEMRGGLIKEAATAAIEALRAGAVERVQEMHARVFGTGNSAYDAGLFIDAILGSPEVQS